MAGTGNLILKRGTSIPYNGDNTPVLLKGMPAVQILGLSETINAAGNSNQGEFAKYNYPNRLWMGMDRYGGNSTDGSVGEDPATAEDFSTGGFGVVGWEGQGNNYPYNTSNKLKPLWMGAEIRAFTALKDDNADTHFTVLKADWDSPSDYVLVTQQAIAFAPHRIWAEGTPGQDQFGQIPKKYIHLAVPSQTAGGANDSWDGVKSKKIIFPTVNPALTNALVVSNINTSNSDEDVITLEWGAAGSTGATTVTLTGTNGNAGSFTDSLTLSGSGGITVTTTANSSTATIGTNSTVVKTTGAQTIQDKTFIARASDGANNQSALFKLQRGSENTATASFVVGNSSGATIFTFPSTSGNLAKTTDIGAGTLTITVAGGLTMTGDGVFGANQDGNDTFGLSTNATSNNTASTIVARDASGNFNAGTITASLTGNVTGNVTGTTTNIAGGAVGSIPYQSAANTTAFLADPNINNAILIWNNTSNSPEWSSGSGITVASALTANTAGVATTVTATANNGSTAYNIPFLSTSVTNESISSSVFNETSAPGAAGAFTYNPSTATLSVDNIQKGDASATAIIKTSTISGDYPVVFGTNTGVLRTDNNASSIFRYDATSQTLHVKNLNVTGSETVTIKQNIESASTFITLNSDLVTAPTDSGGIILNRGTNIDTRLEWNESTDRWEIVTVAEDIQIDSNGIVVSQVSGSSYKFVVSYNEANSVGKRLFENGKEVIITGLTGSNGTKYNGTWVLSSPTVGTFTVTDKVFSIKNLDFVVSGAGPTGSYKITCPGTSTNTFLPQVGQSVVISNSGSNDLNGTFKITGTNTVGAVNPAFDVGNSEVEFYIIKTNDNLFTNLGNYAGGTSSAVKVPVNSNYATNNITYTDGKVATRFAYPIVHTSAPTDVNTAIASVSYTTTGGEPIQTIYNAKLVDAELNNLTMTGTWNLQASITSTELFDLRKAGFILPWTNTLQYSPASYHNTYSLGTDPADREGQMAYDVQSNTIKFLKGSGTTSTGDENVTAVSEVVDLTAAQTLTNKTLTAPVITNPTITTGSINNTPIGGTTANTGAFTTITASGTLAVTGAATFNGNTTLGNSVTGDTLTIDSTITNTSLQFGSAAASATNKLTLAIPASGNLNGDITVTLPTWGGTVVVPSGNSTDTYLITGKGANAQPQWIDPDDVVVGGVFVRREKTQTTTLYPIPFLGSTKGDNPSSTWASFNQEASKLSAYLYTDITNSAVYDPSVPTNASTGLMYEVGNGVGTLYADYIGATLDCGTYA